MITDAGFSASTRRNGWAWIIFLASLCTVGLAAGPAGSAEPRIIKVVPNLSANALAGRADTDLLELSDGRRIPMKDVRRLKAAGAKLRAAAPHGKTPKAFRSKPAATGSPVNNSGDLAAAMKRSDGETVVLPSGRRTTVGMIRFLQPEVEKRMGRKMVAGAPQADRSGPAIKVDAKADWKSILQKPDGTVLEAPDGKRITVGELKQALASAKSPRRLPPVKK